jgi:hypothetical protein
MRGRRRGGLSGFVTPGSTTPAPELTQPVYFSVIINGMPRAPGAPWAERVAVAISEYPKAVPLSLLEPRS